MSASAQTEMMCYTHTEREREKESEREGEKRLKKTESEVTTGNLKIFLRINITLLHHRPDKYELPETVSCQICSSSV